MNARSLVRRLTDSEDNRAVCLTVVLRAGKEALEALTQKNKSGDWGLPGGHQKVDETEEAAAARELVEETGIETTVEFLANIKHHSLRGKPARVFYTVVDSSVKAEAGSDAKNVKWRAINELEKLSKDDQAVIRQAAKLVHNPEALLQEAIELSRFPVHCLIQPIAGRGAGGVLIALEGSRVSDCSKTLVHYFSEHQLPYHVVMPRLSAVAESTLDSAHRLKKLTPLTESLIRAADALQVWETDIKPRLDEGKFVICAPWLGEVKAKCLARGLEKDLGETAFHWLPQPDVTIHEDEDFDPAEYFNDFIDRGLNTTFHIVKSGADGRVYADDPFRDAYLVYSDDKDSPATPHPAYPEWNSKMTRTFEGYLYPTIDGTWQAVINSKKVVAAYKKGRPIERQVSDEFANKELAAYALYRHNRHR